MSIAESLETRNMGWGLKRESNRTNCAISQHCEEIKFITTISDMKGSIFIFNYEEREIFKIVTSVKMIKI